MEQHHRDIIKNNLPDLVSATKDVLDVVRRLMELNIINKWMAEYIKVNNFFFLILIFVFIFSDFILFFRLN